MATNIPVPAAQAALSLLSLSSGQSSSLASHSPSVPAPTLGRFVHTPRSTASVLRSPAVGSPGTIGTSKRRPSSTVLKRRPSDATRPVESTLDASETTSVGKAKKGQIFKCETCSKVYRHPNCLVKHRWEHSPHWREASKFLLSKHQQVQMLEAAAILSHISPQKNGVGTSLPEDRSLWPAYLSGGLLPTPGSSVPQASAATPTTSYREREASVSTSAIEDDENNTGESSAEDEHEDSGYGSSSAAAPPVAVPGFRATQSYAYGTAMSVGGHEYMISSSHAACDAGAHIGSMLPPASAFSRSISSSSFGVSSLRERDDDKEEDELAETGEQDRKWDHEDESMAMDMDL